MNSRPLVALNTIVPRTMFQLMLEAMRGEGRAPPRKTGRPAHDAVRMLEVLVLRELYALSDEQVEWRCELAVVPTLFEIDLTQNAPDYTAIWCSVSAWG